MDGMVGLKILEVGTFLSVATCQQQRAEQRELSPVSKLFYYHL